MVISSLPESTMGSSSDVWMDDKKSHETVMVYLKISCRNLKGYKRSIPNTVCRYLDDYSYLAKYTEMVARCRDPKYTKVIIMNYYANTSVNFVLSIYEMENENERSNQESIAYLKDDINKYVQSSNKITEKRLLKQDGAVITIEVKTEYVHLDYDVHLRLRGMNILETKSNVCLLVAVYKETGNKWKKVYTSECITNDNHPNWKVITIPELDFCDKDFCKNVHICWETGLYNSMKTFIGGFKTSPKTLMLKKTFVIRDKHHIIRGNIIVDKFCLRPSINYDEYIKTKISTDVILAIDFTISNGAAHSKDSYHYHSPKQKSFYSAAIYALRTSLEKYNSDHRFQVYGFGAKKKTCHNRLYPHFPINFNSQHPYCSGIEEVIEIYTKCLNYIYLFISFDIVPLIETTLHHIERTGCYSILIVFTADYFTDIYKFECFLPKLKQMPLSIIIIGIGNGDFKIYHGLQQEYSDENGYPVMFVSLADYMRDKTDTSSINKTELLESTFHKIPDHIVRFLGEKRILPPGQKCPEKTYSRIPPSHSLHSLHSLQSRSVSSTLLTSISGFYSYPSPLYLDQTLESYETILENKQKHIG